MKRTLTGRILFPRQVKTQKIQRPAPLPKPRIHRSPDTIVSRTT
jgi:hypothetical protein